MDVTLITINIFVKYQSCIITEYLICRASVNSNSSMMLYSKKILPFVSLYLFPHTAQNTKSNNLLANLLKITMVIMVLKIVCQTTLDLLKANSLTKLRQNKKWAKKQEMIMIIEREPSQISMKEMYPVIKAILN